MLPAIYADLRFPFRQSVRALVRFPSLLESFYLSEPLRGVVMALIRRVRTKRILLLAALLGILGAAAVGVYKYQKNRTVNRQLAEARQFRDAGETDQSRERYATYLAYRPNDATALAEYV